MGRVVLVPLDGSPAAEIAIGHARAVAPALDAGLVLLHVLEGPRPATPDVSWQLREAEGRAYLHDVAEGVRADGTTVDEAIANGAAADEIVRRAREADVALVVLAAHGHGDARAFELGGTSHKVLSRAPASVMVVRRGAEGAPPARDVTYRHVLVLVDGSPACEWALGLAAAVVDRHGATLHLLYLVPAAAPEAHALPPSDEEQALRERLEALGHERGARTLDAMADKLAHTGLTVHRHLVATAQAADAVRTLAQGEGIDLVALAAHGAGASPWPYGALAQRLLATSRVPVLVFQDAPHRGAPAGPPHPGEARGAAASAPP